MYVPVQFLRPCIPSSEQSPVVEMAMRNLFTRRSTNGKNHAQDVEVIQNDSERTGASGSSGQSSGKPAIEGKDDGVSLEALVRGHSVRASKSSGQGRKSDAAQSAPLIPSSGGPPLDFSFHSMALQVKDAERSLHFYQEVLGMQLIKHSESDDFSMYFLSFPPPSRSIPTTTAKGSGGASRSNEGEDESVLFGQRKGMLQLIHVHGTEDDDSFKVFTAGPGFTHFSVSVPDVDKARQRMEQIGITIVEDGSNARGFAAIADPDGYNIQLVSHSEGQDDQLRKQLHDLINDVPAQMQLRLPSKGRAKDERLAEEPSLAAFGSTETTHRDAHGSTIDEKIDELRRARGGSPVSPHAASPST